MDRLTERDALGSVIAPKASIGMLLDRIRAMSDEELAAEIAWLVVEAFEQVVPEWKWKINRDNRISGTAKDVLDWLQSPAGEENDVQS